MLRRPRSDCLFMTGVGFCLGLLLGLLLHLPSVSSPREGRGLKAGEGAGGDPGALSGSRFLLAADRGTPQNSRGHPGQVDRDLSANIMENRRNKAALNSLQSNYSERSSPEFTQERITGGRDEDMKNHHVKGAQSDRLYRKYNIPPARRQDYDISGERNPHAAKQTNTRGEAIYESSETAIVEGPNGIYVVGPREKDANFGGDDPDSVRTEYEHTGDINENTDIVMARSPGAAAEKSGQRHVPASKSKSPDSQVPSLPKPHRDTPSPHPPPSDHIDGDRSVNNKRQPSPPRHIAAHQNKMADTLSPLFRRLSDVISGVYWTGRVEALVPGGFTAEDLALWRGTVDSARVVRVEEGCGRMQNRRLVFDDGRRACARYRINTDQIQGEIYSFYLSRLLGVVRVLPSVLAVADTLHPRWLAVDQHITHAQWSPRRPAVLTPWMDGLTPAYIPAEFRGHHDNHRRRLHPTPEMFVNKTLAEVTDLVQWSDLIIYDYLTANLDRVVNNMFNLQWNPDMMKSPAHNLEKSREGALVFLDNESGLFHSYRLLDKYAKYHEELLKSLCVFRRETSDNIKRLHRERNVGELLMAAFRENEPLHELVPSMPEKNIKTLQSRIDDVHKQITHCESIYAR